LLPCQRAMSRELEAAGLTNFFYDHVMRLQPHLVRMMVLGVSVDVEWKGKIADELGIELTGKLFEFHKAVQKCGADWDEPPNPNSPKQIKKLLFDDLELKGHGKSTDKANRQRIIMHPETSEDARRMLQLMDEYKVDKKFHSTYALSRIDEDDRMRSEYKQFGTKEAPGRLSSSGNLWGTGANMQNQPERAYPMFCADEGYELTYFDLSQAEARIVAYGWNVMALKENFIRSMEDKSYDVHRANAERIFHVAYEDTPTKDRDSTGKPTIRFLAKRCVHGLNYRMGPGRLSEVCGIPYTQAEEAYRAYHFAFREIRQAWRHMITDIRKTGVTWSYMGRRLLVLEHMDNEALDSIVAFKPQSTIGDKVSGVIYLCHDDPAWPEDARIILNIHDALVAMNRPEDREIVMKVMKHHAEAPININGEDVVIPAEFKHSTPDDLGIHRWSALEG
jgi:DNA polymerase I-like protein with 3'-5' exonuclease and polymerase domains